MPSFAERLRMKSIYGGGNAFTPRDTNPLGLLDQMIKRLPREEEPTPLQMIQQNAEPERQQVFAQAISPYQQALIEQRQKELGVKEKLAGETLESREKIAGEREETRRSDLDIKQQRADIYKFKSENPNVSFVIDKITGNRIAINPATGATVRDFGKNQLGQEEEIELNAKKAIELEGKKQEGRETLADINARHRRELEEFKSGVPSKSATLPSQKRNQVELNYNILINRRPDLAKFVERDQTTGDIRVKPEGATQGQIDEINSLIFGSGKEVEKGDIKLSPDKKEPSAADKAAELIKKYTGGK